MHCALLYCSGEVKAVEQLAHDVMSKRPKRHQGKFSVKFICVKCKSDRYEVGEIHVAGGFWSRVFDVEGRKFTSVTCSRCRHTEFYKANRNQLANIFDLFVG